jgi:hypothetical protein
LKEVGVGAFIFVPKGVEHAFWNEGTTPANCSQPSPLADSSGTSRNWLRGLQLPAKIPGQLQVSATCSLRNTI